MLQVLNLHLVAYREFEFIVLAVEPCSTGQGFAGACSWAERRGTEMLVSIDQARKDLQENLLCGGM